MQKRKKENYLFIILVYSNTYYNKRWANKFPADSPVQPWFCSQHGLYIFRKSLQAYVSDEKNINKVKVHCKLNELFCKISTANQDLPVGTDENHNITLSRQFQVYHTYT
jgi:hypothetical protein